MGGMILLRRAGVAGCLSWGLVGCGSVGLEDATSAGASGLVDLEPAGEINFGNLSPYGRPASVTARVSSVGAEPVLVDEVWVEADQEGAMYVGNLPFPLELAPGEVAPFDVKFLPDGRGAFHGRLIVSVVGGPELERNLVGYGCEDADHNGAC